MSRGESVFALAQPDTLTRRVTVSPAMCSAGSLIYARLGDWTWEAVNAVCGTNVYAAKNAHGLPAYLSFYYFRVLGGEVLQPNGFTFGDELSVTSRVFGVGSSSVLTVHRIARADSAAAEEPLEPWEIYERPRPDCMYAENLNRWISRGAHDSNTGLVNAAPVGFRHEHLGRAPREHSPRLAAGTARDHRSFFPGGIPGFGPGERRFTTEYRLDPARDLNGVGLVYFASYFSFADTALLRAWRELGRSDLQFLGRTVLDYRLGFFGNADLDSRFQLDVRIKEHERESGHEWAEVVMLDADSQRLLAVASIRTRIDGAAAGA